MKEANLTISTLTQEALLLAKEKKKALSRANAERRKAHAALMNAHFTNPRDMTEGEAEVVLLDARLEELKQSTQTQARALLWQKKDFGRPNTRKQGSHSKKQVTPESQDRVRGVGKRTPVPNPRYQ